MKKIIALSLLAILHTSCKKEPAVSKATTPQSAPPQADYYVSPTGQDSAAGTLSSPFATLERARDAVRELKQEKKGDILVHLRGGRYQLNNTVTFGRADSGSENARITYAAYPGEQPILSGSRQITDWKKVTDPIPGLPKAAQGHLLEAPLAQKQLTLYDAEGLLPRARSAGFVPRKGGSRNRVLLPKEAMKKWQNIHDAEIIVRPHHAWIVNVLPVASVDFDKNIVNTKVDATYAMNKLHFLPKVESCWIENILEELDQPGEWATNTKEGKLYLWPRGDSEIFAPQLITLLKVEGDLDLAGPTDQPVTHLTFDGLTFQHGERYTLSPGDSGLQHDWEMLDLDNALLRLRGTEHCAVKNCHFQHSGSGAIRVDLHGIHNEISGNHIEHLGGGGILLCGYGPGTKDVNHHNLVSNNHLHHLGQIYGHAPGIMVWQSGENKVANNLIHHTNYTGIILSGCMTEFFKKSGRELTQTIRWHEIGGERSAKTLEEVRPYLHTHHNLIENNEIHHVMQELGDGNAIYIRGAGAGNIIRRNYVHHLVTPMIMQCAIRTDGGQRDTTIAENIIWKCTSQGILLKLNNTCENNIIADIIAPPRGYYLSLREGPLTGARIQRNIFYSSGEVTDFINELPPVKAQGSEDRRGRKLARAMDADTDHNLYYNTANPQQGEEMLQKQQANGIDQNSQSADPLFEDAQNGDFRLKPNSPALKMGFIPIDQSKIGLLNK